MTIPPLQFPIPDAALRRELENAYSEPHRHYHNLDHLRDCLALRQRFEHLADRPEEIAIALWFHDAVYDPRRNDNEERSAQWADEYLSEHKHEPDKISRIVNMIRATKSHQAETPDARLMLDLDLAILGSPPAKFQAYDRAIRQEYAWVDESIYEENRRRVLRSFMDRQQIYHHGPLHKALETQARANLSNRLASPTG